MRNKCDTKLVKSKNTIYKSKITKVNNIYL